MGLKSNEVNDLRSVVTQSSMGLSIANNASHLVFNSDFQIAPSTRAFFGIQVEWCSASSNNKTPSYQIQTKFTV
jgi:hypothetical protein